jgi:hypothetical protein
MKEELSSFIASSFQSVWALELLLLLKREQRKWTPDELIKALRASDLVLSQAIGALITAGLVSADQSGISYAPASDAIGDLVEQTEAAYSLKPDAVRRTIVMSSKSGIAAFADAFRLRKD